MMENGTRADTEFPLYPKVADLPVNPTEEERFDFACKLIEEQGELLGDYLFAAVRFAPDLATMERWLAMGSLVERIHGQPITLSYRACDRIAAESREVRQ